MIDFSHTMIDRALDALCKQHIDDYAAIVPEIQLVLESFDGFSLSLWLERRFDGQIDHNGWRYRWITDQRGMALWAAESLTDSAER